MTAINSLTHIRNVHTNVEDSSKHIRQNMWILFQEISLPYGSCAPTTTYFHSNIIWIISNGIIPL
jgi:hypothetical protein